MVALNFTLLLLFFWVTISNSLPTFSSWRIYSPLLSSSLISCGLFLSRTLCPSSRIVLCSSSSCDSCFGVNFCLCSFVVSLFSCSIIFLASIWVPVVGLLLLVVC